jgi:hypothetical protein
VLAKSSTTKSLRKTETKEVSRKEVDDLENEIIARLSVLTRQDIQSIRNLRREFSKRLTNSPPDLIRDVAIKLVHRSGFIPRFFAYELVQHHGAAMRSLGTRSLMELGRGIDNWAAVDTFASRDLHGVNDKSPTL